MLTVLKAYALLFVFMFHIKTDELISL